MAKYGKSASQDGDLWFTGRARQASPVEAVTRPQTPAREVRLGSGGAQDYVLSPDGRTIYIAGNDGTVRAYDIASRVQTGAWHIGRDLGGIDITPDGKTILAVEDAVPYSKGSQWDRVMVIQLHSLDLTSGVSRDYGTTVTGWDSTFADVATTTDGKAILTKGVLGVNWQTLTTFDLVSGTFVTGTQSISAPAAVRASESHDHLVVLPGNISDAPVYVYTSGEGITASHDGYKDNISGFNNGVFAVSDSRGLVAQGLYNQVNIYTLGLRYAFDLNDYKDLGLSSVDGLAFSSDGKLLYILDSIAHLVVAVGTRVWEPVATYAIGDSTGNVYGNGLSVTADGTSLIYTADDGVHLVDLTKGGRVFRGTDGVDTMTGGIGNDTFEVNAAGDTVIEGANGGDDLVRASISYSLADNVEALQLVGSAIKGIGNALDNALTGNASANVLSGGGGNDTLAGGDGVDTLSGGAGDDVLDGGTGADAMLGGAGNDRYLVDNTGDIMREEARAGYDTVETSVSYTLSDNVEALLLTGPGAISGTGNAAANRIAGNAGDNVLSGLGGDDLLEGGGGGIDRLIGGTGADTFRFVQLDGAGASFARADVIADFTHAEGDRVDLSALDADITKAGDQAFTFLGVSAFTGHAGELSVVVSGGVAYLQGDINGDKLIDLVIAFEGAPALVAGDFVL